MQAYHIRVKFSIIFPKNNMFISVFKTEKTFVLPKQYLLRRQKNKQNSFPLCRIRMGGLEERHRRPVQPRGNIIRIRPREKLHIYAHTHEQHVLERRPGIPRKRIIPNTTTRTRYLQAYFAQLLIGVQPREGVLQHRRSAF